MTNLFNGIRAALFDLDGTLIETNIDFARMRRELIALASRHGISEHEVSGLDLLAIVDYVIAHSYAPAEAIRSEAFKKLEEMELARIDEAKEIPGARELIQFLQKERIGVGIVTRNSRRAVEISLAKAGISVDVLLTRDDVKNAKPHPDHLLQALNALRAKPSEAVMIGDHWMDIQGGKAAGTLTVGFLRPDRPDDFFDKEKPDLIVRSLSELLAHFQRFFK
ncbi:MAG: HAD-IA family hydrolase [Armatimonadetes bacterium]|nr:HAD-IA family hydrolase [Armatimonadota bacterium]